ncbi:UDP-3-O-(3-hydroxymyristoyl)glucosamine N-acyltransferase [Candidatus Berkiella aquae]|uniref:UDP-3-O-acylglucosamine N-acyltransferase n=1 Tax=Candidatus Berkiella aquae TaxID=295108 RepID=A0A0Q9YWZ5_9GAMM|nr:UDP-3-O-(3-hydroxymyristoyl)glucosamine N-acyltransferase [Candidatus Berkiella aquae]MCS5711163.1 UDP-3-O-(3-hydroxymyristoyl)glucosamine N-acyltransferase [Candidatus Berkiella aquae]
MNSIEHKAKMMRPNVMTLGALAQLTGATLKGDPNVEVTGVGTTSNAKEGDITFIADAKYRAMLEKTQATAVILTEKDIEACKTHALICQDPKLVFAKVVECLYPNQSVLPSIHESAVIGNETDIHPLSYIGPNCVIGDRVRIGANVILQAGCSIGNDTVIDENTILYPRVTIYHGCQIGKNCTIHSGVIIGSDGFGFVKNKAHWVRVPQVGGVKIGDRVEIGANTTIDRGAIEDTEIGNDVILDNLIQIGHNVKIGDSTAIAACVGIAGSTTLGKHCMVGGGTRFNGHIHIGDFVQIVGCSNVAQSISTPGAYASAITTTDIHQWKKNLLRFHRLDQLAGRVKEIEKKLKEKEGS